MAALMTVLATGLGHLYSGKPKRGLILVGIGIFLNIILLGILVIVAPNISLLILLLIVAFAFGLFCVVDAFLIAKRYKENYELTKYNRWFVYLGYFVIFILISEFVSLGIKTTLFVSYKTPSRSMIPTFLVGDHILVNKFVYGVKMPVSRKTIIPVSDPQRDDIVVFIFPNDRTKDFIKRVIGIGGDKIEIINKKIFINDKEYKDSHAIFTDNLILPASMQPRDNFGPVTVPPNSIFVIGDNRDESLDSRFWGFVDLKDVKGKAFMVYFSLDRGEKKVRWDRIGLKIQ